MHTSLAVKLNQKQHLTTKLMDIFKNYYYLNFKHTNNTAPRSL